MISDNFKHLRYKVFSQLRKPNTHTKELTQICPNRHKSPQIFSEEEIKNKIEDKIKNINFFKAQQIRREARHQQSKQQLVQTNLKTISNLKALISLEQQKNLYLMEKIEKWKKKEISILQLSFGDSVNKIQSRKNS